MRIDIEVLVGETKIAVVIPTFARRDVLARLLVLLERQQRLPDRVVITAADAAHVPDVVVTRFPVTTILGSAGLCAQRNRALDAVLPGFDIVTFLDDDFLPADNYLERVVERFETMPELVAIMGDAVVDGSRGQALTFDEGLMTLRALETCLHVHHGPIDQVGAYGCNMSIRAAAIGDTRFDERLVLYGWQEDIDFTSRLRGHGRVVLFNDLIGVHLGARSGRVSGIRFGYSQVVNPAYLMRKGTVPLPFGLRLVVRNVLANLLGSIWPGRHIDRRGRLRGNVIGALHLAQGRFEPEHILRL